MTGIKARYLQLYVELILARHLSDGQLAMADEATYAGELDRCWHLLTIEEQDEIESELEGATIPDAPRELAWIDKELSTGASTKPRKAA